MPVPWTARLCALVVGALLSPQATNAAIVDLSVWTEESYPAVSGFGEGEWNVSQDTTSVYQAVNGQPTLFFSDFDAADTDIRGSLHVATPDDDDDYVGFVIGFQPGDSGNASADYLLIDWKQATQTFNFGDPSTTPGSTADAGLAVSRVTGVPTADEFWGHVDFDTHPGGGLEELGRGDTLGATGWAFNTTYDFRFVFTPSRLQVYVDDGLELDVSGDFSDGRFAFYNFSQARVTYSAFELLPTGICGDANDSGDVSASDALIALRVSVDIGECLDCVCDADGSGGLGAPDALRILRYSVGQPVTLDCPACQQ
jgi:hypothetical protein